MCFRADIFGATECMPSLLYAQLHMFLVSPSTCLPIKQGSNEFVEWLMMVSARRNPMQTTCQFILVLIYSVARDFVDTCL
jgi:hypothetical protein